MDDSAINLKYLKCKYKVKKWESDFIKENGIAPSKADIKAAPSKIKEAYRIYWKLKTQALENSISIDEDAQDCFTLDSSSANLDKSCEIHLSETIDNSSFNILLNESTLSVIDSEKTKSTVEDVQCRVNKTEVSKAEPSVETLESVDQFVDDVNSKNVWGNHLNKTIVEKKKFSNPKTSVSYSFSEKLFKGFNFNKRNPRKSLKKKTSVNSPVVKSEELDKTNLVEEKLDDTLNISDEAKDVILTPNKEKENLESLNKIRHTSSEEAVSVFNLFDEKVKVLIKSTPINQQQSNLLPTNTLKSSKGIPTSTRTFNKGWLERTNNQNRYCVSNSVDSGIESGESVHSNTVYPVSVPSQSCYLDDEKANDSPPIILNESSNNGRDIHRKVESDDDLVYNSDNENSQSLFGSSLLNKKRSLEICKSDNTIEQALKRIRIEHTAVRPSSAESKYNSTPNAEILPAKNNSKIEDNESTNMTDKERKEAILRKKVSSGKANVNLVRINIQKKVYVRGKKNFNFSKHKKQQWKKKKGQLSMESGGDDVSALLKCHKCGEVGHFARFCIKGLDKLIPKEEFDDMEDECPFPSLEEAEELAREIAEQMSVRKKKNTGTTNSEPPENSCEDNSAANEESGLEKTVPVEVSECYSVEKKCAPPLFKLNEDGTVPDTPLAVHKALLQFGHSSFRAGQEVAVMRTLCGLSTLVTLSTGSGKSLCYQLPAYLYRKYSKEPCITLVISPLISLMEDQIVTMSKAPIKIGCFHMNQTNKQRQNFLDLLESGEMDVLLVSPEMIVSNERRISSTLSKVLQDLPPIAFVCIDEAHCISQWSSNFRPSYLMLCKVLRDRFGVKTFLGLTATATQITISGITDELGVPDGQNGVVTNEPLPKNLVLTISNDVSKDMALIELLQSSRFGVPNSVIIYCTKRDDCERVAVFIRTRLQFEEAARKSTKSRGRISVVAEPYHAGLSAAKRKRVQESFMSGALRIVVATIAFGMGINKQDIRGIIHYNIPNSFERYVQEVGRAGRDGELAYCHLFLDHEGGDLNELRRHVYGDSMDRHTIRKLLQRVFVPCKCKDDACSKHEVAFPIASTVEALDLKEESIATLLCYLELHPKRWITNLPNAYTLCRVQSYKGGRYLCRAALKCPPLAVAVSKELCKGVEKEKLNSLSFPIVNLAAELGWDSGMLKYHMKQLEWSDKGDGVRCRTGITVEFSELGFLIQAPGNLSSEELDAALDSLYKRVKDQETTDLTKLHTIFEILSSFSQKNATLCLENDCIESSNKLKAKIREYFVNDCGLLPPLIPETKLNDEERIACDIRSLVSVYRDCTFTSRAIARIFHGIASPNFPALAMSRNKFWRAHLHEDFNLLCALAAKVLLSLR